ncbi:hypothetical protein F4604DRAFT_1915508 [Suillus subluteus]|nr:hypothetical protein F4604DRAFT_1915508 [Suillus subluteus]
MLIPAVQDLLEIFGSEGMYIFIERSTHVKPSYHIQWASDIIAANTHFPTKPNVSVTFASEIIHSKPDMLQGMINTIANDISVTIVYADSDPLATYLVAEALKLNHLPYVSTSGMLMEHAMGFSQAT